jgi:hypothetical protein
MLKIIIIIIGYILNSFNTHITIYSKQWKIMQFQFLKTIWKNIYIHFVIVETNPGYDRFKNTPFHSSLPEN